MNLSFKNTFLLNCIALAIGIFSLVTAGGFITKKSGVFTLGQAYGFSPMPLPFREFETGDENMNGIFTGSLFKDGYGTSMSSDDIVEDFLLHERPHRATIPYYMLANYFSVIPYKIKYSGFRYICRQYGGESMLAHIAYTAHSYDFKVLCK